MKRLVSIAVGVVLTCMAVMVNTAYAEHDPNEQDNETEFHVVDDLYVGGWNGTWNDPDVEIYGFSMFGSTTAYNNRWHDWSSLQGKMPTTSTGAVVILGDLVVGSTAYFHRSVEFNAISTFTAGATFPTGSKVNFVNGSSVTFESVGNIYINGGQSGKALFYDPTTGSLKWDTPSAYVSGDNLGNHTATQNLNMNNYAIVNVSSMTFSNQSLAISSGSAYFGGENAGITVSTNVEVIGAIKANKFYGDASGLIGVATLNNTTPWRLLRVDDNRNVVDAGIFQVGPDTFTASITVDASSFTVVNTALFKSSVTVEGDANGVGLMVNANATIGSNTADNSHTINGAVTVHANPASKKLMQIDDGTNVVAYFKKK